MLSIITVVLNGERFIEFCIKNVIDQACPDVEHIIIDGGSTDRTIEIIKWYAQKYSHIRWISEEDSGQSDAMNKGIAMAKGEIISFLNVDDFYERDLLNRVLQIFKTLPEPSLLVGNCNIWDDEDKLIDVNKPAKLKLSNLLRLYAKPFPSFPVNPSAYFYHTSLHQKVGGYKVDEHYVMDLDFLFRAVQVATVKYVDETWGNWRLIRGTKTHTLWHLTNRGPLGMDRIFKAYIKDVALLQRWQLYITYPLDKNLRRAKHYLSRAKYYLSRRQEYLPNLSKLTKIFIRT